MSITTCAFAAPQITEKSSEQEQVGYSFGYLMGKSNMNALNNLDFDSFVQGFQAGYKGQEASLSNEQMINILNQYKKKADAKELLDFQKAAEQNLQEGAAFLKDNASKAGVKTTASDLQ